MSQFGTPGAQRSPNAGPLADLVRSVQAFVDRPVVNATGLTGNFERHLIFAFGAQANRDLPSIFTAVEEHLGLRLERTGPVDVLVIDSVEMPAPD